MVNVIDLCARPKEIKNQEEEEERKKIVQSSNLLFRIAVFTEKLV